MDALTRLSIDEDLLDRNQVLLQEAKKRKRLANLQLALDEFSRSSDRMRWDREAILRSRLQGGPNG